MRSLTFESSIFGFFTKKIGNLPLDQSTLSMTSVWLISRKCFLLLISSIHRKKRKKKREKTHGKYIEHPKANKHNTIQRNIQIYLNKKSFFDSFNKNRFSFRFCIFCQNSLKRRRFVEIFQFTSHIISAENAIVSIHFNHCFGNYSNVFIIFSERENVFPSTFASFSFVIR